MKDRSKYSVMQGGAMPNSTHSTAEIEEAKEAIKREIRKEMKIKEGAEKLKEVTTDKKSLADVHTIVKKANNRLQQLQEELNEINLYLLVSSNSPNKIE
ncbi:PKN-like protein, partial [Mya arenaria]